VRARNEDTYRLVDPAAPQVLCWLFTPSKVIC